MIDVKNRYYENYPTQNVIGFIPGRSEKVIVFTAHYDMLGSFGEGNYFPGASDNASGTAMVLDLARHFSIGRGAGCGHAPSLGNDIGIAYKFGRENGNALHSCHRPLFSS